MALRLWFTDQHHFPLPDGHKFPLSKYRLLRERLAREPGFEFSPAPLASREAIERAHDPAYVAGFLEGTLAPAVMRRIGFPWSPELVARTLASAGSTLAATDDAISRGIGGTLAGGTHHAFRGEGSGFCVFNDLAIAVLHLRASGKARKAAVVDLDVHQGDGTAKIFDGDDDVLTLSLHGRNNFPFRKQASTIDIELADGTSDEAYLTALRAVLPNVFAARPDVVFYQAGVDPLATDRLGKLALSPQGLAERDRMVLEAVRAAGVPCVITLGGGYSEPVTATVEAHATTFRIARDLYLP